MNTAAACTLFEGHYHHGAGALLNSLHISGFQGKLFVGYRGERPFWADGLAALSGIEVVWISAPASAHFTHYKPEFMETIFESNPDIEQLTYFDPDIVLRVKWSFVTRWIKHGVAVVQEGALPIMPSSHPIRLELVEFGRAMGLEVSRRLEIYFNAGFCGVSRDRRQFLLLWRKILDEYFKVGAGRDRNKFSGGEIYEIFHMPDQDALNLAAMCFSGDISAIGPEGMDFWPSGWVMSHATGSQKPWKKSYIFRALAGFPASRADKEYWRFASGLVCSHPYWLVGYKRASLKIAGLIGRFYARR